MLRKPRFTAASLAFHFQPRMAEAFPLAKDVPGAMEELLQQLGRPKLLTISDRLVGLKRLFDEEGLAAA